MKDTKMDLTGFDDNTTTKKNGCNKSITLKVNPKGNEMVATDSYIETCEVLKSKIQKMHEISTYRLILVLVHFKYNIFLKIS